MPYLRMSVVLLGLAVLVGCGSGLDVGHLGKKTTRLEVVKTDSSGHLEASRILESPDSIQMVLAVVSNSDAPEVSCDYNYELRCFDGNDEFFFLVELNSADICQSAVFKYEGELYYRYLDDRGADYLETLFN